MTYADFTLESAVAAFGLSATTRPLFPGLRPVEPPGWFAGQFARVRAVVHRTGKSRREFLVAPFLSAADELSGHGFAIHSGRPLDVDPANGLAGDCDFLLGNDPAALTVRPQLLAVVDTSTTGIHEAAGPTVARLVAARQLNRSGGQSAASVFGFVTSGTVWQAIRLDGSDLVFDSGVSHVNEPGGVLAVLVAAVDQARRQTT